MRTGFKLHSNCLTVSFRLCYVHGVPEMKTEAPLPVTVLLVDDNIHGLSARKVILQEQGYSVDIALSGEEAWDLYQKQTYDVVVTDFRMTGMDGVELIRLIRSASPLARTILLSGFVGCLGMTEQSTGADEVICKSNREMQDLIRSIRRLHSRPARLGPTSQKPKTQTATRSKAV